MTPVHFDTPVKGFSHHESWSPPKLVKALSKSKNRLRVLRAIQTCAVWCPLEGRRTVWFFRVDEKFLLDEAGRLTKETKKL